MNDDKTALFFGDCANACGRIIYGKMIEHARPACRGLNVADEVARGSDPRGPAPTDWSPSVARHWCHSVST
ncbi:MAG: hypothetical protein ACREGL_01765 [Alphaproteobacteria bacterium]